MASNTNAEVLGAEELETLQEMIDRRVEEKVLGVRDGQNSNFVQMYRQNMRAFRRIIQENSTAAEIFYFFVEHMDYGNSIACSSVVLEEITQKSRSTVSRALKLLKERNFIDISKMGTTNVYHINATVAWSTFSNNKQYAKLNATIVLSKSEQDYAIESSLNRQVIVKDKGDTSI